MGVRRIVWVGIMTAVVVGFSIGLLVGRGIELSPGAAEAAAEPGESVKLVFEEVGVNISRTIHRAPVPGGWLVAQQNGLAFVPDPDHKWANTPDS